MIGHTEGLGALGAELHVPEHQAVLGKCIFRISNCDKPSRRLLPVPRSSRTKLEVTHLPASGLESDSSRSPVNSLNPVTTPVVKVTTRRVPPPRLCTQVRKAGVKVSQPVDARPLPWLAPLSSPCHFIVPGSCSYPEELDLHPVYLARSDCQHPARLTRRPNRRLDLNSYYSDRRHRYTRCRHFELRSK
jgi:hypothetical protein